MKKNVGNLSLIEFAEELKYAYKNLTKHDLIPMHTLIKKLSVYDGSDFGNLSVSNIEERYPYFLLETKHASINCFLLYKKIIENPSKYL